MAKSLNTVTISGRLTRDPETRTTTSGKSITSFSLAVDRNKDETYFIGVTAWEKTAELVNQYLHKGSRALIMGRLRQETWDDKETGKQRSKLVVVANDVVFLDSKQDSDKAPEDVSDSLRDEIDALPF